jgi:hypothetical protein
MARVGREEASLTSCVQIGAVKEKISAEKGWETSLQRLIYSGTNNPKCHRKG